MPVDQSLTIVICVDHANVTGGQAKVAFDSAIGLARQGHRPIVFTAAGDVDAGLRQAGVEVISLGQPDLIGNPSQLAAAIQGVWNWKASEALGRLLADLPRDRTIVHIHGWAKALSPAIATPIAKSGLPVVYTIHEYFLFCPNGGFYNYQENHACGLQPLSLACWATHCDSRTYARKLWRNARLTFAKHILHLPEVVTDFIGISDFQTAIVGPHLPAGAKLHRVSNPVDAQDFGPKTDPGSGDIIFVGRISPEKGPFLFADAARKAGLVPTYVGDGPAASELKTRYPEARILGWQKPEAARAAMRAARALVFPSLWYEGQPLTVLEAKALGVPVIVSDACSAREEVEDGVTGMWFKGGDAEDLARALQLAKDDASIARMSLAAHNSFWADPPTLDRHVERITAIYRTMIDRKRQPDLLDQARRSSKEIITCSR